MRRLALPAALMLCAACAAQPAAVRLDDVAASAYQAGRTQQAEQTQAAATATAGARGDAWTMTAQVRTEVYAAGRETLEAAAYAATARALTPTLTPVPSETPAPTVTPRPTWTMTPDATRAALVQDAARIDRDNTAVRGWMLNGLLLIVVLGAIAALVYGAARMWVAFESAMADARRKQHLAAGPYYDMASGQVVGLLPAPPAPAAAPEPAITDAESAEAARQWAWRVAVLQIALYAEQAGSWAYESLGPAGWGVVSRPGWDALTEYLSECGVIVKRPRTPTRWADGVTRDSLAELVRGRGLPRAYPPGSAPVLCAPRSTGAQAAHSAQAA